MSKHSFALTLIVVWLISASFAAASVQFDIGLNNVPEVVTAGGTGNRWLIGTGYGDDGANEASGTLLEVLFDIDGNLPTVSFNLMNPGDMNVFSYGSIDFQEEDSRGTSFLDAAETDNLGVTAFLIFDLPTATGTVTSVVAAVTGTVNDNATDYSVLFAPVVVLFGVGGSFQLDLIDHTSGSSFLEFDGNPGQGVRLRDVDAKVTLLSPGTQPPGGGIGGVAPEPMSLVVWSLLIGAVSVGGGRRR